MAVDIEKLAPRIDSFLDRAADGLDPAFLRWLQKYAEMHIAMFAGEEIGDLRFRFVLDTNFALAAIRYYAKGGMPKLLKMAKNPMFPIYAPPALIEEVEEKIELFAREDKLDKAKMEEAWSILRKVVKITSAIDPTAKEKAAEKLGSRDPDDVVFFQVYLEKRAVGILTSDNDYDDPDIRVFGLTRFNKMVTMFHRGVYSFFIMHNMLPKFLGILGKILLVIARAVFKIMVLLAKLALGVISGVIETAAGLLRGLPDNVKIALGIAALAAAITAMVIDRSREKIVSFIGKLYDILKSILQRMSQWFSQAVDLVVIVVEASKPYGFAGMTVIGKFYQNVIDMTEEIKKISAAAA